MQDSNYQIIVTLEEHLMKGDAEDLTSVFESIRGVSAANVEENIDTIPVMFWKAYNSLQRLSGLLDDEVTKLSHNAIAINEAAVVANKEGRVHSALMILEGLRSWIVQTQK